MLTGNNGVLTQAKSAKEKTGEKGEQERVNLAASSAMTLGMGTITTENLNKAIQDEFGASKSVTGTGPWTYQGEYKSYKIEKSGATTEVAKAGTKVTNPASYGENPTAQATADGEGKFFAKPNDATYVDGTVDTGVVIRDKNQNEWVWVPVDDASIMYQTAEETALAGNTGVTTNKYSKGDIIRGVSRGTPNSGSFREPDILTDKDTDDTAIQAGFTATEDKTALKVMAESLVQDYSDMIESITKYKGFYIGRYELSIKTNDEGEKVGIEQKDKASQTRTSWYNLYKYSKNIAGSENMQTRMIWGCQWDVTCKWLISSGAKIEEEVLKKSSSWGNYYDSVSPANSGNYEKGKKKNTGSNENWKANNIYDLAGNCDEWTQEAISTSYRATRGGSYNLNGFTYPASYRNGNGPDDSSYGVYASRASLYIK